MQRTNIYLDEDQVSALKHLAALHDQSVAALVRQAVDAYLARELSNDSVWRNRLEDLVERVQSRRSSAYGSDEIENDITSAREEVKRSRRAARGH